MSNKDILDNEMNVVILEISNFLSTILILHINLIYKDFSLYQHKGNKKWYHFQSVKFSSKVHKVKFLLIQIYSNDQPKLRIYIKESLLSKCIKIRKEYFGL